MTDIEPIEIKEFISQLVNQIESGVDTEQRDISGTIDIEVSVEKVTSKGGGLKVYVVSGEAGSQKQQIAKAKFSVHPKRSERQKKRSGLVQMQNKAQSRKRLY